MASYKYFSSSSINLNTSGYTPFSHAFFDLPECAICYDEVNDPYRPSSCRHYFCRSCLITWAAQNNVCPLCKVEFQFVLPFSSEQLRMPMSSVAFYNRKKRENLQSQIHLGHIVNVCDYCGLATQPEGLMTCSLCGLYHCHSFCDTYCQTINSDFICEHCRNLLRMVFS